MRCAHCGQTVTVGKRVERYGLVHNGFCFDQLILRLKREERAQLEKVIGMIEKDFQRIVTESFKSSDDKVKVVNLSSDFGKTLNGRVGWVVGGRRGRKSRTRTVVKVTRGRGSRLRARTYP